MRLSQASEVRLAAIVLWCGMHDRVGELERISAVRQEQVEEAQKVEEGRRASAREQLALAGSGSYYHLSIILLIAP